jgi:hypothetical protein
VRQDVVSGRARWASTRATINMWVYRAREAAKAKLRVSHKQVRARVEHVFARMKSWKILRG